MIEQDPGPGLYILPDKVSGERQVENRIIPMIEETPTLASHKTRFVRDLSKSKIALDHMTIYLGWGGSLATMSSNPMKRVWIDEARLMPLTIGNESNAIKLAGDRLTTYLNWNLGQGYVVSSPSVENDLLHQQLSTPNTTELWWYSQCPSCNQYQLLSLENLKRDKGTKKGICICSHCNEKFPDTNNKEDWNINGIYAPEKTQIYNTGALADPFDVTSRMVFRWTSFVSPFRSFNLIMNEYLQTKGKVHDYKNFWQCWLAQFWVDDVSKTSVNGLLERKQNYERGQVPEWTKLITAGIDSQGNGFYVEFRAFGAQRQTALVDQVFIECPVGTAQTPEMVKLFQDRIFGRVFDGEGGKRWAVSMVAIDSGGNRTQEIYNIGRSFSNLILVKGRNGQATTIVHNKDINLYLVRTEEYLEETELKCDQELWWLPHNIEPDYLQQFVNIRKISKQNKITGEKKVIWKKVGQCDYRFACIHTFICLDIPTFAGTYRHRLEEESFMMNPMQRSREEKSGSGKGVLASNFEEVAPNGEYEIGSINW